MHTVRLLLIATGLMLGVSCSTNMNLHRQGDGNDLTSSSDNDIRPDPKEYQRNTSKSRWASGLLPIDSVVQVDGLNVNIIGVDYGVGKDSVRITAVVMDPNGNLVAGLARPYAQDKSSFWKSVVERQSGREKVIDDFTVQEVRRSNAPTTDVALVADYSGSMMPYINSLITSVRSVPTFLYDIPSAEHQYSVVQFDHRVLRTVDLGKGAHRMLGLLPYNEFSGATAMYDATRAGITSLEGSSARKVVVLFTDGYDNSSFISANNIVRLARKSGTTVYVIGLGQVNFPVLSLMALQTGGRAYFIQDAAELPDVYESIFRTLKVHYVISWKSKSNDQPRDVSVDFDQRNGKVSTDTTTVYPSPLPIDEPLKAVIIALFIKSTTELDGESRLAEAIDLMKTDTKATAVLRAHTDTRGSEADNKTLAKKRVDKLKQMFIKAGISASRLTAEAVGEAEPLYPNDEMHEWMARENRRAEILIR